MSKNRCYYCFKFSCFLIHFLERL